MKKGEYQAALKAYSKSLLAVQILVRDNMVEAGELLSDYAKRVIVART